MFFFFFVQYNKVEEGQKLLLKFVFQVLNLVYVYLMIKLFDLFDTVSKSRFSESLPSYNTRNSRVSNYKDGRLLKCDALNLVDTFLQEFVLNHQTTCVHILFHSSQNFQR